MSINRNRNTVITIGTHNLKNGKANGKNDTRAVKEFILNND